MKKIVYFAGLAIPLVAWAVLAEGRTGIYFSHLDWEVACDNTLTCRAAGYQADDDNRPISVLLTRKAGPRQTVTGKLAISGDDYDRLTLLQKPIRLKMLINSRAYGEVTIKPTSYKGALTAHQAAVLVSSLAHKSKIEFVKGNVVWHLSDQGGAAVLLKMDDVQGRVGTTGALIQKGPAGEGQVRAPLSAPVVIAASVVKQNRGLNRFSAGESSYLRGVLRNSVNEDDCPKLYQKGTDDSRLSIQSLAGKKLLASTLCWTAAYNAGTGYWVINDSRPYKPVLVTTIGTSYSDGEIISYQKGRGLADCVGVEHWNWSGRHFVHTESLTTGMCKSLAPGGAWKLPTKVTDLRRK